jgi:CDGSH-type Zn-finger protein
MSVKVKVLDHGPYLLDAEVEIVDNQDMRFDTGGRKVVGLCRCGHSANKPFCDGAHSKNGFQSAVKVSG